jgi:hypothetical protein
MNRDLSMSVRAFERTASSFLSLHATFMRVSPMRKPDGPDWNAGGSKVPDLLIEKPRMRQMEDVEQPPNSNAETASRGRREAFSYGAAFVPVFASRTWEAVAELVRNGWASRYDQVGDAREDWRLSWPAVREGWQAAGGAFAPAQANQPLQPTTSEPEPTPPAIGTFVFDAFGEPAGRVKAVRDGDFLLDRPLARDVYVPFTAIRWPSASAIRINVPNGRIGAMGWERSTLLGGS